MLRKRVVGMGHTAVFGVRMFGFDRFRSAGQSDRGCEPVPCFHCGLPMAPTLPDFVMFDGLARSVCCPACAAAAELVIAHGFSDYYHERARQGARLN